MKNNEKKLSLYSRWVWGLIIAISFVFAFSAYYRWNLVDVMLPKTHDWMTGSTIKFVNNWLKEGAVNLKFMMLENPASIEFPDFASRGIYVSYLPTVLMPVYIICKTLGMAATPAIVRFVNMSYHYLLALIISMSVFYIMRKSKLSYMASAAFAFFTGIAAAFISGAYFFMESAYWTDMAVLPYFALIVMIEAACWGQIGKKQKRTVDVIYFIAMLAGCLIDWLMFFVAFAAFLSRLFIRKENFFKTSLLTALPVAIASGTFLLYIKSVGVSFADVLDKMMKRTGMIEETAFVKSLTFLRRFLGYNSALSLSKIGTVIMIFAIVGFVLYALFYILHKNKSDGQNYYLNILVIAFLPCIMQIAVFSDHSYGHYFSALKFIIPLLVVTFTALPMFILRYYNISHEKDLIVNFSGSLASINIKRKTKDIFTKVMVFPLILFVLLATFALSTIKTRDIPYEYMTNNTTMSPDYNYYYEKFLSANMTYNDFVVSPHYTIPANDPVQVSFSNKRVYFADDLDSTTALIESKNLPDEAIINVFTLEGQIKSLESRFKAVLLKASDIMSLEGFIIYRFTLDEYFDAVENISEEDLAVVTEGD